MNLFSIQRIFIPALILVCGLVHAEESYPPHPDSVVHDGVPKGELVKGTFSAGGGSVFPGTEREYQIFLPAGFDKTKPAPFMVFQDGILYNAPVVFDNLIAKQEIPQLVGVFIKPGVVPAANPDALPRFNRSYEYDSVSDTYSNFLINEFLPAIEAKHGIKLSTDPNDAAICGNSSGGICAFMVGWHRPDRFRRVFSGVGTYVGIHGADQLPVLVRKTEPKPLRVYLQSGENDNNLYCGDWWMANQMMERSLTWAGYDVNHTWGTGGHNQKQATAIFPDVMRWLWRDYATTKEIKVNQRGDSKWRGYEVLGDGKWDLVIKEPLQNVENMTSGMDGAVFGIDQRDGKTDSWDWIVVSINPSGKISESRPVDGVVHGVAGWKNGYVYATTLWKTEEDGFRLRFDEVQQSNNRLFADGSPCSALSCFVIRKDGCIAACGDTPKMISFKDGRAMIPAFAETSPGINPGHLAVSPDQTTIYGVDHTAYNISACRWNSDGSLEHLQMFGQLERPLDWVPNVGGLCVDTEGRLYVATALGIQVCDQAGRVNSIIPTPQIPHDVCFGGKDLGELFIACGDRIYKRMTKAHGYISGQMAPIKPVAPKL